MKNSKKKIAVVGTGVIGLTAALRLLEARFEVVLFTRDDNFDSNFKTASAYWWPSRISSQNRLHHWAKETFEYYQSIAQNPFSGVKKMEHLRFCIDPDDTLFALDLISEWKEISAHKFNVQCDRAISAILPSIDTKTFFDFLKGSIVSLGGSILIRDIKSFDELSSDFSMAINCTGLGSKQLANDPTIYPVRGQTVYVSRPDGFAEQTLIFKSNKDVTLIIPRGEECLLASTAHEHDWSLEPRPSDTEDIISRAIRHVPQFINSKIKDVRVGLRPARSEVRLESQHFANGFEVIHNYGHGGGGFTVGWGCAGEVVERCIASQEKGN